MLGEIGGSVPQRFARLLQFGAPPKNTTDAFGWIGKGVLEATVEGAIHEICALIFGGDLEKWIDPRFDWTLAE
jgi:hypothetical protein